MALLAALVIFTVIARYCFSLSWKQLAEFNTTLFAFTTFWGMGINVIKDEHVMIDILYDGVKPARKRWLAIVNYLIVLAVVLVFTYQGDGDLASIGLAETMSAANRGENISVIFVNNGIYGMTGGQLAPTTLVGMKATTAPKGRDPREHGYPMHVCEILNQLTAPYYLERTSCNNPANVARTKAAIRKAFQNQLDGKGFSLVEIVTSCPTNWGLEPLEALDFLEEKMFKEFPLGVIRDKDKEGA